MADVAGQHIDRADIQGDILRAYGNSYKRGCYVFVHIDDAAGARAWLTSLLADVTDYAERPEKLPTTLNVAFTYVGLQALGLPAAQLEGFSEEFRSGMAARARLLGDVGESDPQRWQHPLGTGEAHVLVTIKALDTPQLDARLQTLRAGAEAAPGVRILHEEHAEALPDSREHFGYADGFAQPAITGVNEHKMLGGGLPEQDGKWRGLALGEFVLGYQDEDSLVDPQHRLPSAPREPLGRSGTYMVFRKLAQDVGLFRRTVREQAALHGRPEAEVKAKIVGRWPNGTPLVRSPHAEDPHFSPEEAGANDFRYLEGDADGKRCPLGAHIRRTNPRDALGWKGLADSGMLSFRHRIIRRGMSYGPPYPDDGEDEQGVERGLLFVCFNASFSRQFEGVQTQWVNDGNAMHLGHDKDFLLGDGTTTNKMTVQGDPPQFLSPQPSLVTTRGGEYLFVPGIAALGYLASGDYQAT